MTRWNRLNAALALGLAVVSVSMGTPLPLALGAALTAGAVLALSGRLTLPNAVTFLRLLLVVGALVMAWRQPALVLPFVLAAWALDGLDGWLARRLKQDSPFGALFDQETDALLVLLLCVELVVTRGFGPWVLIAGALRYVLVLARLLATRPIPERRSTWGRAIFSFSYLSLASALLPELDAVTLVAVPAGLGLLLFSFAPDFLAVARARG